MLVFPSTVGAVENYYGAVDPATLENNSKNQRTGYTEIDVFEFAKALTGWGVSDTSSGARLKRQYVLCVPPM